MSKSPPSRGVGVARPRGGGRRRPRRRWPTRVLPVALLAAAAFAAGIYVSLGPARAEHRLVSRYLTDWARGNFAGMYAALDTAPRQAWSERRFTAAYRDAAALATVTALAPGHIGSRSGAAVPASVAVQTRLFGTLTEPLELPLVGSGSSARIRFDRSLVFPGLRPGETLSRRTVLPARATLLASDGTPLAEGPERTSPIPTVAAEIVGTLGPIPTAQAPRFTAAGYPPDAKVGRTGLERVFQDQLAGTPGGTLRGGRRVLARTEPKPAQAVRTTIVPSLERAAMAAMGGQYAGIAAMDPRTGGLLALAGVAFSALQPPGSTMKIVTVSGALEARITRLSETFPIRTSATLEGYTLQNANGEACGGTLINAFAVSCNSVFAPLGARLGGPRLVDIAERFGFNRPVPIPGAAESTIPPAGEIGGALDVGSSAIGQGKVQASALAMTDVAATIAMGGQRPIPTLLAGQPPEFVRVISPGVARQVERMMIAVVRAGTGTAAQIPGVTVAGKTGTAELRNTAGSGAAASSRANTDAWFVGYAPVGAPRIVVGALFPNQGAGGATAAPAVRGVLVAGLRAAGSSR